MSSPPAVKAIRDTVRGAGQILVGLSHDLHAHPEVAWEEHRSADRVAAHLADAGFTRQTFPRQCLPSTPTSVSIHCPR
jgi:metal-dependent amidase/aminoacylase/carboxypeptidase family protein